MVSETWIFPKDFRKKAQISNFIKIRPVGAELFHANRQTDRHGHDKANSRNFAILRKRLKTNSDVNIAISSHLTPCSLVNVSKEIPVSIFRIWSQDEQSSFLPNAGIYHSTWRHSPRH